jgi:ABC-type lipoprotein release transport system permease subunit
LFTGHLQIQGQHYWEKRSLEESISVSPETLNDLSTIEHVTHLTPRLEAYALLSFKTSTKVAQVIGIDPQTEDNITRISDKLVAGKYLDRGSQGLLIGAGLAEMLRVEIGDSLVIYGQGLHGQIAAALAPVTGIIKLPFKVMDNSMALLALPYAQQVFSCPDRITSIPILIEDVRFLNDVNKAVQSRLKDDQRIMLWNEMMPDLEQNIQVDNVSGLIMLGILYVVIAFGVYGTVMMMVTERAKEFAILISVGMRRMRLILVLVLETILVSFVGVVAGIFASIPLIVHLYMNPIALTGEMAELYEKLSIEPILAFSAQPWIFISQALVVLIIALITISYPILYIRRLEPADTLRG